MDPNTSMPPSIPKYGMGAGISTEFGIVLPPGGKVIGYVHASGRAITSDADIGANTFLTINDALLKCRAAKGDVVLVLPGHTENIGANAFSNLVSGTKIVGLGHGTLRPTLTWTATGSTVLMNAANVELHNMILNMDPGTGTVNVAAPITISAAGCGLFGLQMRMGTDANAKVTIGITTTAAADDLTIANCEAYGATAAGCTTQLRLVGADRFKMMNCRWVGATTSVAVGTVQMLTTASLDVLIESCLFRNSVASSTGAFTGMTGATGELVNCRASVLSGGAAAYATLGSLTLYGCTASNALGGGNAVSPAAQTLS